jgi:TrmH family RNA methyltransferase
MRTITINNVKYIKSLNQTKNRKKFGEFFIEGKRLIESSILYNADIKNIYLTEKFINDNIFFKKLILKNEIKITKVSSKDFQKISNTENPSGVAAICGIRKNKLEKGDNNKKLYLSEISDPGNLGTIIRSAAYFSFVDILLSKNCVDPYNPKVLRSGMGAHFKVNLFSNIELETLRKDHTLIGADQRGENYNQVKFPKKYILVLGNESHGFKKEILNIFDTTISIKKTGYGESLNVSAAGSILMNYLSEK